MDWSVDGICHQIAWFHWKNGLLFRSSPYGARCIVSRPNQCAPLVWHVHKKLDYFRVHRTHSMLRNIVKLACTNWLLPIFVGVKFVIGFSQESTPCHPNYVLYIICFCDGREIQQVDWICCFTSKLIQNSKLASVAFLDCVLVQFMAHVEVLTNQRREFFGSFEELCTKALIDHCTKLQNHPKANSLAKCVVQMVKHGLHKKP